MYRTSPSWPLIHPCARPTKTSAPNPQIPNSPTPALPTTYHPATPQSVRTNAAHHPSMEERTPTPEVPRHGDEVSSVEFRASNLRFAGSIFSAFRIFATFFPPTPNKKGHTTKMLTFFNELTIFATFTLKMRFSICNELTIFQIRNHNLPPTDTLPKSPHSTPNQLPVPTQNVGIHWQPLGFYIKKALFRQQLGIHWKTPSRTQFSLFHRS